MRLANYWVLPILALASCGVPMSEEPKVSYPQYTTVDTIPAQTIQVSDSEDTTLIKICPSGITVNSTKVDITATEGIHSLNAVMREDGSLVYLKADSKILYNDSKFKANRTYNYIGTDKIRVKAGNTLSTIAEDHHTTVAHLKALNPSIERVLPIGKTIKIK